MRTWLTLALVVCVGVTANADILGTQEVSFINAVLGTNISTRGDGALYDLRGHREVTLGDGSVAEYGSILELTEQDRRKIVGATAYLDGVVVTNLAPLAPFCFGIRKVQTNGAVSVARLDYEPLCWVGGVEDVQDSVIGDNGDKTVRVIHSAVTVSSNLCRSVQLESTYSLDSLSRLSQHELSELRVDYGHQQMEFYRNGELVGSKTLDDPNTRGCLARGVVRDEHGAPMAGQLVKVVWSRPKRPIWDSDREHIVEPVTTDGNGSDANSLSRGGSRARWRRGLR